MKMILQALFLLALVLLSACAHHKGCTSDKQCQMKDKSCCTDQVPMKKEEMKEEAKK